MAFALGGDSRLARNVEGAAWMALAMFGVACNDALMKLVLPDIDMFQAILLRSSVAALIVAWVLKRRGQLKPPPGRDLPWLAIRSVAEIGATIFYLNAVMRLRLAEVSAVNQSLPLLLTLAGVLFFGEKVGWRRWAAVIAGFVGVMLVVRPQGDGFNPDSLYAVGGMVCFGIREIATRRTDPATPGLLITCLTLTTVGVTGAVGSLVSPWQPMELWHLAAIALAAGAIFMAYHCGVTAVRMAEINFTAPFRYTVIVWSIVLGALIFGEMPDAVTLLGAAMIVGAGLYAFWRERLAGKAAETAGEP